MKLSLILAAVAALLLPACQTAAPVASAHTVPDKTGIVYGMSKTEVIARSSRTDKIISTQGEGVISEGVAGPQQRAVRKNYLFQGGKLKAVTKTML